MTVKQKVTVVYLYITKETIVMQQTIRKQYGNTRT